MARSRPRIFTRSIPHPRWGGKRQKTQGSSGAVTVRVLACNLPLCMARAGDRPGGCRPGPSLLKNDAGTTAYSAQQVHLSATYGGQHAIINRDGTVGEL